MFFNSAYLEATWNYVIGLCCCIAFYLGLGAAAARMARRNFGDFRPAHARVLTLLLVALGSILPQTLYFFETFRTASRPQYLITVPFHTLGNLASGHTHSSTMLMLLIGGTAVVVFETREQAEGFASSVHAGQEIRPGVVVVASEVFEVTVSV